VRFDDKYLRPAEVDHLLANPSEAKEKLGWQATVFGESLVDVMIEHDLAALHGHVIDAPVGGLWEATLG
jgi:GDPmannose 4,6-dehydratase